MIRSNMQHALPWLAGLISLGIAAEAEAQLYKYEDEKGVVHYVDSPHKIPQGFRDGSESAVPGVLDSVSDVARRYADSVQSRSAAQAYRTRLLADYEAFDKRLSAGHDWPRLSHRNERLLADLLELPGAKLSLSPPVELSTERWRKRPQVKACLETDKRKWARPSRSFRSGQRLEKAYLVPARVEFPNDHRLTWRFDMVVVSVAEITKTPRYVRRSGGKRYRSGYNKQTRHTAYVYCTPTVAERPAGGLEAMRKALRRNK